MSRVVVVGGADQGRQTIDVLDAAGVHQVVAVLDPALTIGATVMGHPVVDPGDLAALGADGFVVAVGDNAVRGAAMWRVRAARAGRCACRRTGDCADVDACEFAAEAVVCGDG